MNATFFSTSRKGCKYCKGEWLDLMRGKIEIEGIPTEAAIEYRKCPSCGKVDWATAVVVIESQHHPNEGGSYSAAIPIDPQAWDTEKGAEMFSRIFQTWLSTKSIESRYGLKSGTVRKAVNRGYVSAKKDGHDLYILEAEAERYWGSPETTFEE